jgi:hypothetical protein
MSKRKTHTIKDIALCFGERTGYFVTPRQIRVRGNWLFYINPNYDDEEKLTKECIDCYFAPDAQYDSGVLSMEAYTGVKLKDSPFIKDNNEIVAKSLKELDKDYKRFLEDIGRDGLSDSGLDNLNLLIRQGVK